MDIKREYLEKRKAELLQQKERLVSQVHTNNGAIQILDLLLADLDRDEKDGAQANDNS